MLAPKSTTDQVECLLRNAELRDQLDPLFDESIGVVNVDRMPTPLENDFLESMLEWERAPMLPIAQWFEPTLVLSDPDHLSESEVSRLLWQTIDALFSKNVVLDFTDHLSDRQLYLLISRDILPSYEKKLDRHRAYLHWDCANVGEDADVWLRYYASPEEREMWEEETGEEPPEPAELPHKRKLPKAPM